ncbi:MAG: class I SAM-dependent methyltransferase [Halioglobus sp.]
MSENIEAIIVEFFEELELLGPADPASTSRALASIALSSDSVVVDVGSGTGRQTLQLLQETPATVVATDLHQSMLAQLQRLASEWGVSDRLRIKQADMAALPFKPEGIDLIWCEAAVYNIGFEQGLKTWLPLLSADGYLCVSEVAYFVDNPPEPVKKFWQAEYPAVKAQSQLERVAKESGYILRDSFRLPQSAWESYYGPVEDRIASLEAVWNADLERQKVLAAMRKEVDVFRRYGDTYGYVFFVLQKPAH